MGEIKTGGWRVVREFGISRGSFDETIEPSRKLASIFSTPRCPLANPNKQARLVVHTHGSRHFRGKKV
jgi:hypothetical protein